MSKSDMFDGLSDFLADSRKKRNQRLKKEGKDKKDEKPDGVFKHFDIKNPLKKGKREEFKPEHSHDHDHSHGDHSKIAEEMKEFVQSRFGGSVQVEQVSHIPDLGNSKVLYDRLHDQLEEMARVTTAQFARMGAVEFCTDGQGNELSVGDQLVLPTGDFKTVLQLGYGYCFLSHTDDQERSDGVWFESDFKKFKFIKK